MTLPVFSPEDLKELSTDEVSKLYKESKVIHELLQNELAIRLWTPTVKSPSTLRIAGAEVQGESNG